MGVARDPQMDKQIRKAQRKQDDDDSDFEMDDDIAEFIRDAVKDPPPGAIPAMRDAGYLPPLSVPAGFPQMQVEPIDDIDPLPMPSTVQSAPTVQTEGPAIQTATQPQSSLPQYQPLDNRKPLPAYEPVKRKRNVTDMKSAYLPAHRPMKDRMTGQVLQDDDGNERKKHHILGSKKRGVEDNAALAMVTPYGETFADVAREFKEMIEADGQGKAKKYDGALQRYPNYLKLVFDKSSFFNTRSDLFKEGADAEAKRIIEAEALHKSNTTATPYSKYITNFKHGYYEFKRLVAKRESLIG